jgi:hypothetical protein
MLARKGRFHAEDFEPLQLMEKIDLSQLKQTWLAAIDDARVLVKTLPPKDAGCLYYDPVIEKFVTPSGDLARFVRHRGSRGGVLPLVGDCPSIETDKEARRLLAERCNAEV